MTPSPSSAHYNSLRIMVTRAKRIANRSCVSEVIKYISALVVAAETDENVQVGAVPLPAVSCAAARTCLPPCFTLTRFASSRCAVLRAYGAGSYRRSYARPPQRQGAAHSDRALGCSGGLSPYHGRDPHLHRGQVRSVAVGDGHRERPSHAGSGLIKRSRTTTCVNDDLCER